MELKKRLIHVEHLFFIAYLLIQLLPNRIEGDVYTGYLFLMAFVIEGVFLIYSIAEKKKEKVNEVGKLFTVIFFVLIVYELLSQKSEVLSHKLFPAEGIIINQLKEDFLKLLSACGNTLKTVAQGYLIALLLAIPLGLFLGWQKSIQPTASSVVRFLSSIPPIVFIPYAIAILPTFRSASVFVIFVAAFWPILSGTMSGVANIEKGVLDSAKSLNVKPFSQLIHIIFPAALPHIIDGMNQGMGLSFILLTSAEMIGADAEHPGLGYYINEYSNFGDFKRVILGIVYIGVVISVIYILIQRLEKYLLRWKRA